MSSTPELRNLPSVDRLLADAGELIDRHGRDATADALRRVLEGRRTQLRAGEAVATDGGTILEAARADLDARRPGPPRRVVNAAGVVVHTNLGRAPLSAEAIEAMTEAAGYCDLEMDLETGERGSRGARLAPLLADVCRAEAGIAVNNAAGALVLALAVLASGREVLVSRGELVEIGGSFRLPEIMAASGAKLVEVGTTNRTRATDYGSAGEDVAVILAVHPSNFRIEGFTEAPSLSDLAEVAAERGVPLLYDAGSGMPTGPGLAVLASEPDLADSLYCGADLVVASGDKLLGGPQAGLLLGRADLVELCRRHPLARALRLDKLRIAALVATLEAHLTGRRASLPVWSMLEADRTVLEQRADRLARAVGGTVEAGASLVGGGAAPGREIPTPVVRVGTPSPEDVARRLRLGEPAVLVRVEAGSILLDPRTVDPGDDDLLATRVAAALSR